MAAYAEFCPSDEVRAAPVIAVLKSWLNLLPRCQVMSPLDRTLLETTIKRTMNFRGLSCYKKGDSMYELALDELTIHYTAQMPQSNELVVDRQARVKKAIRDTFSMSVQNALTKPVEAAEVLAVIEKWSNEFSWCVIQAPLDFVSLKVAMSCVISFLKAGFYKAGTNKVEMAVDEIYIHYYNEMLRLNIVCDQTSVKNALRRTFVENI